MDERELPDEESMAKDLASQLNAPGFNRMESIVQINALDGSLDGVLIPADILERYNRLLEVGKNAVIFLVFDSRRQASFQVSILTNDPLQ